MFTDALLMQCMYATETQTSY